MSMSEYAQQFSEGCRFVDVSLAEALRDIHDSINAIGGVPTTEYERGSNDAVGKALAIIEAKQAEVSR